MSCRFILMSRRPGRGPVSLGQHGRGGHGSQGQVATEDVNGNQSPAAPRARGRGRPPGPGRARGRGQQVVRSGRGRGRGRPRLRHHPYQADFIDQNTDNVAAESGDEANNEGISKQICNKDPSKIFGDCAVRNLLYVGQEPVSIIYYTRLGSSIKQPTSN